MEVLFPVTEASPFVKVGGLADVAAGLPKALRQLGHNITLVMPRYPQLEERGLLLARRLTPLRLTQGARTYEATVYDARLPSQLNAIFIDIPGLLDRPEPYGTEAADFEDNAPRFAAFSRAIAELALERSPSGAPYDLVHVHDWPTALVPFYVRELAKERSVEAPKTVLTIHNAAHQGQFPKDVLPLLGIDWKHFTVEGIEFYGGINFLKFGVLLADAITTVSPTYASEVLGAPHGEKLEGVLSTRKSVLHGIVNGVDYSVYNPAIDPALVARYDAEDASNKTRCKGALQRELGLTADVERPLMAFVGRVVPQKGVDLLIEALPRLLRATEAQFVLVGDGSDESIEQITNAVSKSGGRAIFVRGPGDAFVHRVFAGADFVIVPSRFEPCGLVQMYAQRYGAVPLVHATGGLVDTVVDCDAKLETGTGFVFDELTVGSLIGAIERAVAARALPQWPMLVRRIMRLDRGWERSARRYEQVYRQIAKS